MKRCGKLLTIFGELLNLGDGYLLYYCIFLMLKKFLFYYKIRFNKRGWGLPDAGTQEASCS